MTKRCPVCLLDFDGQVFTSCPHAERHHQQPADRRKLEGKPATDSGTADTTSYNTPGQTSSGLGQLSPAEQILVMQRRIHALMQGIVFERKKHMDAVQTFAAAENAKLDNLNTLIQELDTLIQQFQNSEGQLSVADQAALDAISAKSDALANTASAALPSSSSSVVVAGSSSVSSIGGDSSSSSIPSSSSSSSDPTQLSSSSSASPSTTSVQPGANVVTG